MKHLFLTSQIHHVINHIAPKIHDIDKNKAVFIDTALRAKVHNPQDLDWHEKNKFTMHEVGINFDFYDFTNKTESEIKHDLDKYQIMYVEGGDPFYLLSQGISNNFGKYVRNRVAEGMVYMSTSAGTIVAGIDAASASRPGKSPDLYQLNTTKGYGLVNFVPMPHWGLSEKVELYSNHKLKSSYQEDYPYIFLSDSQYVEVAGDKCQIVDITKV